MCSSMPALFCFLVLGGRSSDFAGEEARPALSASSATISTPCCGVSSIWASLPLPIQRVMSSAYRLCLSWRIWPSLLGMLMTARLKRMGESRAPCGVPLLPSWVVSDVRSPMSDVRSKTFWREMIANSHINGSSRVRRSIVRTHEAGFRAGKKDCIKKKKKKTPSSSRKMVALVDGRRPCRALQASRTQHKKHASRKSDIKPLLRGATQAFSRVRCWFGCSRVRCYK